MGPAYGLPKYSTRRSNHGVAFSLTRRAERVESASASPPSGGSIPDSAKRAANVLSGAKTRDQVQKQRPRIVPLSIRSALWSGKLRNVAVLADKLLQPANEPKKKAERTQILPQSLSSHTSPRAKAWKGCIQLKIRQGKRRPSEVRD